MPRISGECKACEGSGVSTSGFQCRPCQGKGYLPEQQSIKQKVAYVKSQGQTRDHHCHWPGCGKNVPPAVWGCKEHWFNLPKHLRDRIWATYSIGQEVDMSPSREYLEVTTEVKEWIKNTQAPIMDKKARDTPKTPHTRPDARHGPKGRPRS